MKKLLILLVSALLSTVWYSCQPVEQDLKALTLELPSKPYSYSVGVNDNVPALGRVLFYDRQLSVNNSIACASCHKQSHAFSDNVQFSVGFENVRTHRNSMPIQNLSLSNTTGDIFIDPSFVSTGALFWDGRELNLRQMVLRPIANHVEMGVFDFEMIKKKLKNAPYYAPLFEAAYGNSEITTDKIADALAFFLISIRSTNTKLDKNLNGKVNLSALELKGQQLFFNTYDCNSCHQVQNPHGYLFAGGFANIGLEQTYQDNGLQQNTKRNADAGKFKIPSLRNVMLTAPYMHDGRFNTLESVIDHYSEGMQNHPNLDFRLREASGEPRSMNIPDSDKEAIIAFLNTLTDLSMISDPKFSNPFRAQ